MGAHLAGPAHQAQALRQFLFRLRRPILFQRQATLQDVERADWREVLPGGQLIKAIDVGLAQVQRFRQLPPDHGDQDQVNRPVDRGVQIAPGHAIVVCLPERRLSRRQIAQLGICAADDHGVHAANGPLAGRQQLLRSFGQFDKALRPAVFRAGRVHDKSLNRGGVAADQIPQGVIRLHALQGVAGGRQRLGHLARAHPLPLHQGQRPGPGYEQHGRRLGERIRHSVEPAHDGRDFALINHGQGVALDELGHFAAGGHLKGVLDCLLNEAAALVPLRGPLVQVVNQRRLNLRQLILQQLAKQPMITVPGAFLVQGD